MSAQTPGWKLALRAIFRALTFMLPFAFAGRLDWWRGWLFVGSLLLIAGVSFAVLRRKNPDLMRRRLEWQPGVKRFDRFVLAATIVGFLSFYAVAGLDASYGWSQLSAAWIWPGIALELLGFVPIYLAIAENPFLRKAGPRSDRAWPSRHHHGTVSRGASPHVFRVDAVAAGVRAGSRLGMEFCAHHDADGHLHCPYGAGRRRPVARIAGLQGVLHPDTLPTGSGRVVRSDELLYDAVGHIRRGRAGTRVGRARAAFLQDGVHGPFQRRRRSLPLPCCYSLIRTVA